MPASESTGRRRRPRGRPFFGTIAGLMLGVLVAANLILAAIIRFDSPLVTVLPPLGALLGFTLGWLAPLQRRRRPTEAPLLDMVVETDEPTISTASDLRHEEPPR